MGQQIGGCLANCSNVASLRTHLSSEVGYLTPNPARPLAQAVKSPLERGFRGVSAFKGMANELDYWLALSRFDALPLPVDYPDMASSRGTVAQAATLSCSLSQEETRALLQEVPAVYHTQINDLLLTALVLTFAQWTGHESLLVDLEGHGREELFADDEIDLSRTVGWFTSIFPVRLDLRDIKAQELGPAIQSIKEQLRQIPRRGIGYGILRYLSQDARLEKMPQAEVSFNYLGQATPPPTEALILGIAKESSGPPHSPQATRSHLLEINGIVAEGQLRLEWTYSQSIHQRATIQRLATGFIDALSALIAHCQSPEAGGYTPSDFPLAQLEQATVDRLTAKREADKLIEDIYPLSPMQQGMLYHTLYAPHSGVYITQFTATFHLSDPKAWQQAWQQVVNQYDVLRTEFDWSDKQPLQLVRQSATLPWQEYDWQALTAHEQEAQLEALLKAEREQGFELDNAPLMRCILIKRASQQYQFIWTHHHLLMDGWCTPIIFKASVTFYQALTDARALTPSQNNKTSASYRDYIAWLQEQDMSQAEAFWRQALQGFSTPTPLGIDRARPLEKGPSKEQHLLFSSTLSNALHALARQHHLTLNTLVQGAWALLLSHYSGHTDVLFGATVSGRPPALAGVESMVGLFINTLPVRVQLPEESDLLPWLLNLQSQQVEREQYAYTPLVEIASYCDVPRETSLFESAVVFENYPVDDSLREQTSELQINKVRFIVQNNFPLTVRANPAEEGRLKIDILYQTTRFDAATITRILTHFETLFKHIVKQPSIRLAALKKQLADADTQQKQQQEKELANLSRQKFKKLKRKRGRRQGARGRGQGA